MIVRMTYILGRKKIFRYFTDYQMYLGALPLQLCYWIRIKRILWVYINLEFTCIYYKNNWKSFSELISIYAKLSPRLNHASNYHWPREKIDAAFVGVSSTEIIRFAKYSISLLNVRLLINTQTWSSKSHQYWIILMVLMCRRIVKVCFTTWKCGINLSDIN